MCRKFTGMRIEENYSLRSLNTFGIEANCRYFIEINSLEDLKQALTWHAEHPQALLIVGGGSNLLFTKNHEGLCLKMNIQGIEQIEETEEYVHIRAGAGVIWHELVQYCVQKGYHGMENLSLIPGTVGAAPMQNIGAYGVELKEVFHSLKAINRQSLELHDFSKEDCDFGYRHSIFKTTHKDQYIIYSVDFLLSKKARINTSYGAIQDTLKAMGITEPSSADVSRAVIQIRQSKLPDPKITGNAGSFFKNPTIKLSEFERLQKQFPTVPSYPVSAEEIKVPAGWLIEQCGWKGKRIGDAGVHPLQALVLVNYGKASGQDIWNLAMSIQKSVQEKFGIRIQPEVNIV
ncbi:UDP-N-acetylmuramate dehydrogenase [Cytophagales bacterium LB-30]|uniref:UDP-N-acetylenolpyruvoylglucosamine reductase n=1 Tax=Shiella aurantiaca TaxID=3058365 RepID=A0ABT8F410_9BACT|nr:UDP-N-acetylmuramate dehydrogenase [Shiella aurantiaca]MDN4165190.1 UDP-N-acetylmuramate dehydrogenase [Shiella aurantiaca]